MSKRQKAADRGDDPTINHGTPYGYDKKGCRCERCVEVGRAWARGLPSRQGGKKRPTRPMPESAHGTSGWTYWGCKCDLCKASKRASDASQRTRRKAMLDGRTPNAGKPWTPEEIAVITDPAVTDVEAALKLGRPVTAVNGKIHRLRVAAKKAARDVTDE